MLLMMKIKNILILCTGNSCRSQIAEGYLRTMVPPEVSVYGAGLEAHGLNPKAVSVMKEDGIDISHHTSKTIEDVGDNPFDMVITVCDHAHEHCPVFPGVRINLHENFPDPAKMTGSDEEVMDGFRNVRDMIREYLTGVVKREMRD